MRVSLPVTAGLLLFVALPAAAQGPAGPAGGTTAAPQATAPGPKRLATMSREDDRRATLDRRTDVALDRAPRPPLAPRPALEAGGRAIFTPADYLYQRMEARRPIPGDRPADILKELHEARRPVLGERPGDLMLDIHEARRAGLPPLSGLRR